MVIDTLAYTKKLEAAGVERRAAEAHAEAMVEALGEHVLPDLATKADIAAVRADIEALRVASNADIAAVRTDLEALRVAAKADIEMSELRLRAEISDLRGEMRAGEERLRGEMHAGEERLHGEMRAGEERLHGEIAAGDASLRAAMMAGDAALRTEIANLRGELTRWVVGTGVAAVLALTGIFAALLKLLH
jgi:hypothetical protein